MTKETDLPEYTTTPSPLFAWDGLRLEMIGDALLVSAWNGDPLNRENARITFSYLTGRGRKVMIQTGTREQLLSEDCDALIRIVTEEHVQILVDRNFAESA